MACSRLTADLGSNCTVVQWRKIRCYDEQGGPKEWGDTGTVMIGEYIMNRLEDP